MINQNNKIQNQTDYLYKIFDNENYTKSIGKIEIKNYNYDNLIKTLSNNGEFLFNIYDEMNLKNFMANNKILNYTIKTNNFKVIIDYVLNHLNEELEDLNNFLNTDCDDKDLRNCIKRQKALITKLNNNYNLLK